MKVATEILNQLGGNRFIVMTGVKNLVGSDDALTMHLPRNASKAKYLRIELNDSDYYNLIFRTENKKEFTFPIVAEHTDVHADMLQAVFTFVTGLYTRL
jgi:hypothetical protein